MRIGETSTTLLPLAQQRFEQAQEVQSVFSAVLQSVGRGGYESAEQLQSSQPLEQQMRSAWEGWFELQEASRNQNNGQRAELNDAFGQLMDRAYREGGYVDPKTFLSGLAPDEMENLRQIHLLADTVDVGILTEEGALNLLIPPVAQVDLNRDGLTQTGIGYGIRFPDSTTPKAVADAWHQATADLPEGERMTYALQMKLPTLLANLVLKPDGSYSHQIEPGDPNYKNPMADADYSYGQAIQARLQYLDDFRNQLDPVSYERDRAFWADFQGRLPDRANFNSSYERVRRVSPSDR